MRARALAVAAVAAVAYALLGLAVRDEPPQPLDLLDHAGRALAGEAPRLALVFTASCWWPVLVGFGIAAIGLAIVVPAWRGRVIFSLIVTVVAWQTSNGLKQMFARPRPTYWLLHHETSYAYSSGHALFATIVYGLWSGYVAKSALPRAVRLPAATLIALWAVGIVWSRLSLGAHWVTDLIGGALLGVTMLALGAAAAGRWPHALRSEPPRADRMAQGARGRHA